MSGSTITSGIGTLIRPRLRVLIAGSIVNGLVSAEVESNNYARGDTFHCELAPDVGTRWFDPSDDGPPLDVQIQGAMLSDGAAEGSASGWTTLIQGGADTFDWDPVRRTLSMQGRDYSSKLIELSTSIEVYLNKVSSEIVSDLAQKAGLTAMVDPTSTVVGQYYQIEHKRHGLASHSKQTTAWDLMMRLARIERYDLWVSGTTVYFKKQLTNADPAYQLQVNISGPVPISQIENLRLEKQAGISRGVKVQVLSWDSRQRRQTIGNCPKSGSLLKAKPNAQLYTFVLPNLTQDRADAEAAAYYAQIVAHQRTLTWSQPGDFVLQPRQRVTLGGTNSGWDDTYRIDSVARRYSREGGLMMSLTVRNRDLVASEIDGTGLDE